MPANIKAIVARVLTESDEEAEEFDPAAIAAKARPRPAFTSGNQS